MRDGLLVEPYHDRVREAVLAHMEPDTRVERHARLAIALEGGGAAMTRPELLVRHLDAAGQAEKAAELAARAARGASKALAFDRAAQLYRTALRLGAKEGEELVELRMALGSALANAGHGPEAAEIFLVAAEEAGPVARLECQRCAAEQYLAAGCSWGEGGPKQVIRNILDNIDRDSMLARAREDILARIGASRT